MTPVAPWKRPRIGVTGPDEGGGAAWWLTRLALWRAGALARRITPARPRQASELDGLVIGGGADVAPELYGRAPPSVAAVIREEGATDDARSSKEDEAHHGLGRRLVSAATLLLRRLSARKVRRPGGDPGRDELETRLIEQAFAAGKPILGICRGAQLLNVHFGGTLHQELATFYEETPQVRTVRPKKRIEIAPGSRLAGILRTESCLVNALHRQAVDRPAESLRVVARETAGVVQAVEHPGRRFVLGVQWHPEYLPQVPRQRRIFSALVEAARRASYLPFE